MNRNKKLIIVFYSMGLGGVERKIIDIIQDISINQPNTEILVCLKKKEGIFLSQIPINAQVVSPKFSLKSFFFTFWLTFQILKFNPTNIFSYMDIGAIPTFTALKILFWKKPKVVIGEEIHTSKYLSDVYTPSKAKSQLNLIKKYYPQAYKILVPTTIQKKDLNNILGNSHNIVPLTWLPLNYPPKTKKIKRTTDILFIGRVEPQKNIPLFINIAEKIIKTNPNLRVKIVGGGSQTKSIKKLILSQHLSSNIKLIPPTTNPQKYFLDSKIFLLTSDYEGFPLTLMEAISCGCYPICKTIPEIKPFFNKYSKNILFNKTESAVSLINKTLKTSPKSDIINHYRSKLINSQQKNLTKYINYCLS